MEEKIVNGVLCYPKYSDLKGAETEWVPYAPDSMTTAFISMRAMYESADRRANKLDRIIESISKNINDYFINDYFGGRF